jgi:hypothetical protein
MTNVMGNMMRELRSLFSDGTCVCGICNMSQEFRLYQLEVIIFHLFARSDSYSRYWIRLQRHQC